VIRVNLGYTGFTELIQFVVIIGLKRVLKFIMIFSIIRAGLREAARVLA
jgi:hypothetical protein